jgi:hypothetical protein
MLSDVSATIIISFHFFTFLAHRAYENAKLLQTQELSLAASLMPEPSPCLSNLAGASVISYGESSVYIFGGRGAEGPVSRTCLVNSLAETAWDEKRLINVSGEEPSALSLQDGNRLHVEPVAPCGCLTVLGLITRMWEGCSSLYWISVVG